MCDDKGRGEERGGEREEVEAEKERRRNRGGGERKSARTSGSSKYLVKNNWLL